MDNDATVLNAAGSHLRQKRVLPSRSRRGGPGVGNCDVDVMILNTQLNKSENEPLIPADTPFVFKTNDTLEKVAKEFASAGGSGLNLLAHQSYFERPEVLKAYREQTIIETPEYTNVSDTPSVGGRLRVRTTEENNSDSDAVYEKRHRKYESFEKRGRLREKEKLKHEQYKLKERIDQLRAMDNSAFLAAPSTSFSPRPGVPEVVEDELGILGGLNGNPAYLEGERRRREMLMNAQTLEERYRVLLPPDRVRKPVGQSSLNVSLDPDSELSGKEFAHSHDDGELELDEDYLVHAQVNKKDSQKLKLKLPARPNIPTPPLTTSRTTSATSKKRRRSLPPFIPPAPPPTKSPAVPPRKPRMAPVATPFSMDRQQQMIPPPTGVPGPSSLQPRPDLVHPVEVISNIRFLPYQPQQTDDRQPKQPRRRPPVHDHPHKRAKTEGHGVPSSPPRDYADSLPVPESPFIVVDDEPVATKRSTSSPHDTSPTHDTSQSYSFPPVEPPPAGDDAYAPTPESFPPRSDMSIDPISPVEATPEPIDFDPSLRPPTPPPAAEETPAPAPLSVPPQPIEVESERKASVPPIESISAPVPTPPTRRGRGRGRGGVVRVPIKPHIPRKPPPATRAPPRRVTQKSHLEVFAERTAKNPRQLYRSRLEAFGVKLPPIVSKSGRPV
ncbi:hypothetical protein C8F04DRAFT_251954 [Mycena alexandri]|uniref:PEHE domain-containing protein n=1 Tax=Mycena alexandri TaxID=1745969 RepID=A0AAD6X9Y0_9AGAR|nr:hypothetical protein C8F04DRAFT_251954 [Mycena alexandri]